MLARHIYVRCESCSRRRSAVAHYAHSSQPTLKKSNLPVRRVVRVGPIDLVADQSGVGQTILAAVHHVDVCYNAAG